MVGWMFERLIEFFSNSVGGSGGASDPLYRAYRGAHRKHAGEKRDTTQLIEIMKAHGVPGIYREPHPPWVAEASQAWLDGVHPRKMKVRSGPRSATADRSW
jgi:hypothetical protein